MKTPFIVLIISYLFFLNDVYPSSLLEFERLNSSNGLSSEEIRNVFQDSKGYLWFLTTNGLNRYDGYAIKVFKDGVDELHFPSSAFESICEDNQNRLWLGTVEKGLYIYDRKLNKIIPFQDLSNGKSLIDSHIRSLHQDKNNNIWIGTEYGLYKYNIDTEILDYYNLGNLNSMEASWCIVETFLEDSKGNFWIGTWANGLFKINSKNEIINYNQFDISKSTPNANRIKSLFEDSRGNIWVGTWEDGLYEIRSKDSGIIINRSFVYNDLEEQSISGDIIYSINQDANENIWIGTPYGLTIIEEPYTNKISFNNISYNFELKTGLSNNEIWKIYKDNSGLMWLGTLEGGINKVHPDGIIFESYNIPPISSQIFSQTVKSFFSDMEGELMLGVKSLGFGTYNMKDKAYLPYYMQEKYNALPRNINTVNSFVRDGEYNLWLGTRYNGLIIFNEKRLNYTQLNDEIEGFNYEPINALLLDSLKNVWVGNDAGLIRINKSTDGKYEAMFVESLMGYRVTALGLDNQNGIWVGTAENGVFYIQDAEIPNLEIINYNKQNKSLISNQIHSVYCDSKGKVWIGTADKGIIYFDNKGMVFHNPNIFKGTMTDAVFAITEDELNNLWLTTNNGLIRFVSSKGKLISDSYTVADGLLGNIFVPGSMYKDSRGNIFVGTYYGFNTFSPKDVRLNKYKPNTQITEIRVNNERYNYSEVQNKEVILKHFENKLRFTFSAMSFYKPDKNHYAYKLEGLNEDWEYVSASTRKAEYSNLGSGKYTFLVKSANSSELWNQEPIKVSFEILSAPYKTWWAYLSYLLIIISIIVVIYRMLLKNERIKRAYEIEKIEHAKSEKLNQFKLKFFTNISHELLTPLSIISCSLDIVRSKTRKNKDDFTIMSRNINQLDRLLHQLLDFRKMESGHLSLKVSENNYHAYIKNIIENFKPLADRKNISINLLQEGSYKSNYFDSDKLDKVLDNLLTNSIKYTSVGGSILVSSKIHKENNKLMGTFSVRDTGKGIAANDLDKIFNRFYRSDVEKEDTGTGIGLAFTKNLVELHKGNISANSEVGKGSVFTVNIPLHLSAYSKTEISNQVLINNEIPITNSKDEIQKLAPSQINLLKKADIKLLLIDDNKDFRTILKSHFSKFYRVIEASDGEMAFQKAIEFQPDIIVSDVLMPKKNGIELCLELKKNIDTKYIPIILLTAETAEEQRSKAYKAGADSYISKPISLPVLESRINALLIKRHDLKPLKSITQNSKGIQYKTPDHIFISDVEKYIIEELSEPSLSVKSLAIKFAMSDSMLFRRIKKITSLSPVEYIKSIRLNQAALLLRNVDAVIADVSFNTGFYDQSYFTACFKKQFGKTPRNYMKSKNKF